MDLNFNEYSLDALYQSFETIDDIEYPDRALTILGLLIQKSGLSINQLKALYEPNMGLEAIGTLPIFSTIASDLFLANNEVLCKLNRLLPQLQSTHQPA